MFHRHDQDGDANKNEKQSHDSFPLSSVVPFRYKGNEGPVVERGETLDTPSLRRFPSTVKGLFGSPLTSDAEPIVSMQRSCFKRRRGRVVFDGAQGANIKSIAKSYGSASANRSLVVMCCGGRREEEKGATEGEAWIKLAPLAIVGAIVLSIMGSLTFLEMFWLPLRLGRIKTMRGIKTFPVVSLLSSASVVRGEETGSGMVSSRGLRDAKLRSLQKTETCHDWSQSAAEALGRGGWGGGRYR